MASQGPLYPGTVTTETGPSGDNDWTNPGNISSDNATEAQITAATYDAGDHSFRLKAQNFGFTIPSGATIDGIVVEIDRRDFAGDAQDQEVRLYNAAGTLVGDDKQTATSWPTASAVATYGSSTDTWAASLTAADINDPDFGVALIVLANSANTDIGVDYIRVTVHYTEGPVVVTPTTVALVITTFEPTVSVIDPNAPFVRASSSAVATATQTTLVVPVPTGTVNGDLLLMIVHVTASAGSITDPAGWTPMFSNSEPVSSTSSHSSLWRRIASSEPADYTITHSSGRSSGAMIAIANVDQTTPIDIDGDAVDAVAGTSVVAPTVTASDDSMLIALMAGRIATNGTAATWTPDAAMTEQVDASSAVAAVSNSTVTIATESVVLGATGTRTATASISLNWIAYSVVVKPAAAGSVTATPTTVALVITTFAPTVTATNHQLVTPTTVALVITTFAPTVTASDHQLVTPTTVALVITTFAPTVSVSDNQAVTPTTVALVITTFAPTVSITDHQLATPDPVALVLTTFAPTVTATGGVVATPDPVPLVITTFAPTVSVTDHQLVTPDPVALAITTFAPTVTVSAGVVVTPDLVPLVITTFAPTVTASDHQLATPTTVALVLTLFAPTVTASDHKLVTPTMVALVITTFAPTVTVAPVLFTISGYTRDSAGAVLGSVTVHAFRTSDDVEVAQVVSNAISGYYEVDVADGIEHYLVAYKAGSPDVAGTTVNTLVGS